MKTEVLLAGNTGYITEKFIAETFPECHVHVLGNPLLKTNRRKDIISLSFPREEADLAELFKAHEFEEVVYFSNYLTFHGEREGELEQLRRVIQHCRSEKNMQVVYLNGPEGNYSHPTGKTVLAKSAEQLCLYYSEFNHMQLKIIRIPYLYSAVYEQDYFYHLFQKAEDGKKIVFPESPEQRVFFLCMEDLSELLYRLFDGWDKENEILSVPDCFDITFAAMGNAIEGLRPGTQTGYSNEAVIQTLPPNDKVLRSRFGWYPKISILTDLPELYEEYRKFRAPRPGGLQKIRDWIQKHLGLWRVVELIVGFFLMEILNRFAGNNVQFRMIDLRLLFIVLMGTLYGMNIGVAAAALESLSLIVAYAEQGTNWATLFYEPANWIPFIAYFIAGAICGYVRLKNRDNILFVKKENELIQEKFFFMQGLYREALQDKREYKKQIIGSRDSFGKIYDITRQLDVVQPQELYIKTIQVMENVLENHTISIYSVGKRNTYARLEAASRGATHIFAHSIRKEDYSQVLEALEEGEVWANDRLLEGYPMYMAGIRKEGELALLIMIHEVDYSQMTLYYQNLLKILCGLVETSLLRVLDYQMAIRQEQYLEGTGIMNEEYFLERLDLCHSMKEQNIADYTLVQVKRGAMSLEEADDILETKIRENDIIGLASDGSLYLILTQTAAEYVPVIMKRLQESGFECKVVTSL